MTRRRSIALAATFVALAAAAAGAQDRPDVQVEGYVLQDPRNPRDSIIWNGPTRVVHVRGDHEAAVGALRGRWVRVRGQRVAPPRGSRRREVLLVVSSIVEQAPPGPGVQRLRGRVARDERSGEHVLVAGGRTYHLLRQLANGPLPPLAQLEGRALEVQGIVRERLDAPLGVSVGLAALRREVVVERAPSLDYREVRGHVLVDGDDVALATPAGRVPLFSTPDADVAEGPPSALLELLRRSPGVTVSVAGWALLGPDGSIDELLAGSAEVQADGQTWDVYRSGAAHARPERWKHTPPPARADDLALDGARAPTSTPGLAGSVR